MLPCHEIRNNLTYKSKGRGKGKGKKLSAKKRRTLEKQARELERIDSHDAGIEKMEIVASEEFAKSLFTKLPTDEEPSLPHISTNRDAVRQYLSSLKPRPHI